MEYRCEATTLEGFVQQLAVCYVGRGYFYYVTGSIPQHKDARAVDRKLISGYGITAKKWKRAARKAAGLSNLQYIRFRSFFVLLSSEGQHQAFWEREKESFRDVRRSAIKYGGYQIGFRGGHVLQTLEGCTHNIHGVG